MTDLYSEAISRIEQAYDRLGHRLGWRFLTSPERTLRPDAQAAFITLNPGGDRIDRSHGVGSSERGCAYLVESWAGFPPGASPLQRQVRLMLRWLDLDPNSTLSAYFIPFRSPSFEALPARDKSYRFAVELWGYLLESIRPPLVVCMGEGVERGLRAVWGPADQVGRHPLGWGTVSASVNTYPTHTLVRLPHLSRFRVFGRPASVGPLHSLRDATRRVRSG